MSDAGNGAADQSTRLNPFDPNRLRLTQAKIKVKEHLTNVQVRRPAPEWWVRTHHSEEFRIVANVLELKEGKDRDLLLVDPEVADALADEPCISARLLITSVTRQNTPFIWPLRLPNEENKLDSWNRSAMELAELAAGQWIRIFADPESASYKFMTARADLDPPVWPDLTFEQILQAAFKNHFVDDPNHPILRKLRGES